MLRHGGRWRAQLPCPPPAAVGSGSGGRPPQLRGWRRSEGSPGCCSAPPPRAPCRGGACRPRPTRAAEVTGLFGGEAGAGAGGRRTAALDSRCPLRPAGLRRGTGALARPRRCEPWRGAAVCMGEPRIRARGGRSLLRVQNGEEARAPLRDTARNASLAH